MAQPAWEIKPCNNLTTVYQAYIELEKRGVVAARQKSGYYVKPLLGRILLPPEAKKLRPVPKKVTTNTLAYTIRTGRAEKYGSGVPAGPQLPQSPGLRDAR
jgi:DNA-binding transcriptional regulator YhcF (GntR family)